MSIPIRAARQKPSLLQRIKSDPAKLRFIREKVDAVIALEEERKAINSRMETIRCEIEEAGFNRKAFKAAVSRYKLTDGDREEQEESYNAICAALGIEHQPDMIAELKSVADDGEEAPRLQ